ncbi:MAG TPA: efflux transporter outer membrane subunit [Polyangiales bacterium]|nr:efflux transporter outer membrane subunit [Polyangiales bacterium]
MIFAGCAVGPDYKRPDVKVPESWSASKDPRIATQTEAEVAWWKGFNDPILDKLIDLAYRQNLTLQIGGLRIAEARAQLGIATGQQYPQVQEINAGVDAMKLPKQQSALAGTDSAFFRYQVGFDAVWEIDLWGKFRRGVEAEAMMLYATVADYYYALVSTTAEVARIYAVIRTFEVLIDQATSNVVLQEEALRIAEARYKNGATSELDVTQAQAQLESTRASIPRLQGSLLQARNALSTLLGQTPGSVEALLAGPKTIPNAPNKVAISVPADMLRRRPDVRAAELYAAAQCARIGVAKAELYPSFSLFGSVGLQNTSTGGNFLSSNSLVFSVGPHISFPFFNYGRITNSVRVQDARFQQQLVGYKSAVLKAAQEVEDALAGFLNSQQAVVFEEKSVTAATRSEELALVQYREGAVDFERVLDAQRVLLQRQNALAQTRSDVVVNVIALYKSLGGGWQTRQSEPIVSAETQQEMQERTDWGDLLEQPRTKKPTQVPPQQVKH